MKELMAKTLAVVMTLTVLAGCTNEAGEVNKQGLVGLTGAVAGGVIGSNIGKGSGNTVAILGGAILGGLLGSEIGKSLDKADVAYAKRTQQTALESHKSGTTAAWRNPDTGASGTITPSKAFEQNGRQCREFTQTVSIGGKTEKAYGTACRQSDGSWQIVQE